MPFEIIRNDIVNMSVDAVVNSANPDPVIGFGVDSAIHHKAGKKLLLARQKIGPIAFGEAAITSGFELDARYVIHTVGPVWIDGHHGEAETLAACYHNTLALAKAHGCTSIAFPLIATGNDGFPKQLALQIAVTEISAFLLENDLQVYLVVFGKEAYALSEKLFQSISTYIDENYSQSKRLDVFESEGMAAFRPETERCIKASDARRTKDAAIYSAQMMAGCPDPSASAAAKMDMEDLGQLLGNLDASFSETLLNLIDRTGKKDVEIYKKANVDRKLFSKIRNNRNYRPSKATALAFAFALELDLDATKDLIARAGFALSHSSKFDVIVEYFLVNKNYNVFELNTVLFAFDQPLLGA